MTGCLVPTRWASCDWVRPAVVRASRMRRATWTLMVSCWINSRSEVSGPVMRSRMRSAFAELGLAFVRREGVLRGVLAERFFAENRPFDVGMGHLIFFGEGTADYCKCPNVEKIQEPVVHFAVPDTQFVNAVA